MATAVLVALSAGSAHAADYPRIVGPQTGDQDAVQIIEKRTDQQANGEWGDELTQAVRQVQRRHDLKVDGVVGSQTLRALRDRKGLGDPGPLTDVQAKWLGLDPLPPPAPPAPAPKPKPAPAPAPEPEVAPAPAPAPEQESSSSGYAVDDSIVQCESGGDYGAVNPSSGARGAYQIMPETHAGICPDLGWSPSEQDECAGRIMEEQGPSAWTCSG